MSTGISRFVGLRLKEAREARGLTVSSLADLIGVTRQAVSQYENGQVAPSANTMSQITRTLNIPLGFFLEPVAPDEATSSVFYRSMSATTKSARARAERHYGWLRRVVTWLRNYVTFPEVSFPTLNLPSDPHELTPQDIELAAQEVRRQWQIPAGPIPSMTALLERRGAMVVRMELCADTLDAFSEWRESEGRPYLILGADKAVAVRSRYDASHELGHMVLHRHVSKESLRNSTTFSLIESQAHRFAGALLLPEMDFADDLYVVSLDALRSLKEKWRVSMAAMLKRASDLNLIAPDHAQQLWRNLARRGWRLREPLDDDLPVEEPSLVKEALDIVLRQGIVTAPELETRLALRLDDITRVCGLPLGYFDEGPRTLRLIRDS